MTIRNLIIEFLSERAYQCAPLRSNLLTSSLHALLKAVRTRPYRSGREYVPWAPETVKCTLALQYSWQCMLP